MKKIFIIWVCCWLASQAAAQQAADTLPVTRVTVPVVSDSLRAAKAAADSARKSLQETIRLFFNRDGKPESFTGWLSDVYYYHPYFGFTAPAEDGMRGVGEIHEMHGKDGLFYLVVFLLVVYALIKNSFVKYFSDLFRVFFRTTLKQRQITEQLTQAALPSLLLNIFFIVTGGLYITFMLQHFGADPVGSFWLLFLYACLGLSGVYIIKFTGLKLAGWLFDMQDASESYIFIVFVVNKMIGILLLPFLVILSFSVGNLYSSGLALSWFLIGAMLVYRFILTFAAVRNQVRVNPFHFFLYLCAFEITPLLLVYKALLEILRISA